MEEVRSEAVSTLIKRLIEKKETSVSCQRGAARRSSLLTPLLKQLLWGQPIHSGDRQQLRCNLKLNINELNQGTVFLCFPLSPCML